MKRSVDQARGGVEGQWGGEVGVRRVCEEGGRLKAVLSVTIIAADNTRTYENAPFLHMREKREDM